MKFRALLLSLGLTLIPSISKATLWWATWDQFDSIPNNQAPDTNTFPGAISPPGSSLPVMSLPPGATSSSTGGSNDGSFADINPAFLAAGINNGFVTAPTGTNIKFTVYNNVPVTPATPFLYIIRLSFDLIRLGAGLGGITWQTGNAIGSFDLGSANPSLADGGHAAVAGDWQDYSFEAAIPVNSGDSIDIRFVAAAGAAGPAFALDNIAIIAVPETAGVLGVTALLGSSLMMRYRRRKATAEAVPMDAVPA